MNISTHTNNTATPVASCGSPEAKEEENVVHEIMTNLTFAVHRREPSLVVPAAPTPRETKRLSDTDDHEFLRMLVPFIFFYHSGLLHADPASVIRSALAEALVPYYPLAGRVLEVEGRKLVVDCTGEGVLFVEADANVRMAELEAAGLRPPFPCMDQLLFDAEGSGGLLNCPLLLIQVTRLLCGGFVFALRFNHTICDGVGLAQFMFVVAEFSRGHPAPLKVEPAWSRDLLGSRSTPKPTFPHLEFDTMPIQLPPPSGDMVMQTFSFGTSDIAAIKTWLPQNLRDSVTSFEALTVALWRARTAALKLPPDEEVRLPVIVNFRKLPDLALPAGYYGNASAFPMVLVAAGALLAGSLADAVELVRNAKATVSAEYVRSMIDFLVLRGRPCLALANALLVSDLRHIGFHRVDFGWGQPVYGGPVEAPPYGIYLVAVKNGRGEEAVAVPIALPRRAMDRFASEVEKTLTPRPVAQAPATAPQARI